MINRFFYFLLWPFIRMIYPVKVIGKQNINKKKNYLFLCNHRGSGDPIILFNYIKKRQHYLVKKEFLDHKWEWIWLKFGAIPVDRKNLDLTAIKTCLSVLKNGGTITIFPEGTRADTEQVNDVKNGSAMLAIRSGVSVIPCFIPRKVKPFHKSQLIIGKELSLENYTSQKLTKEVLDNASQEIVNAINNLSSNT